MSVCCRPTCTNVFPHETKRLKGELVNVRTCASCREIRAEYMRKYRATEPGRNAKQLENASMAANECCRRYNASVKGKARTVRQAEKRKRQRQEREASGANSRMMCIGADRQGHPVEIPRWTPVAPTAIDPSVHPPLQT